jgi:hypothetical protein
VELRYVHDATLEEIALTTETTTSAVGQRLSTIDRLVSGVRAESFGGPIASPVSSAFSTSSTCIVT